MAPDRDYSSDDDFRAVFAESLMKLFHVDPFAMNIFPGYKPGSKDYLDFMKQLKAVDA